MILGRWNGKGSDGSLNLKAREWQGKAWTDKPRAVDGRSGALAALWARGRIRDLEDAYALREADFSAIEKEHRLDIAPLPRPLALHGLRCRGPRGHYREGRRSPSRGATGGDAGGVGEFDGPFPRAADPWLP